MNSNSSNYKIYTLKIKVKKNKMISTKPTEITKPIKYNSNYYYELFKDIFIYCGIHLETKGLKEDGRPRKNASFPYQYDRIEKSLIKNWTSRNTLYKPNGIIILNKKSNICSIDVDKPDECSILEDLMKYCLQIHKTRNGFHFIFKSNDLPYQQLCGVCDINTNLFFVPEYKNENGEVVGSYKIIKNEGLVDMPDNIYKYCEELIKNKSKNKVCIKKDKKDKNNETKIINYKDRVINEIFNLNIMNVIYEIHYHYGSLNNFKDWLGVCWIGRHLNNTDEGFKLFYKWSRKVKGYENEPEEIIKSHFYQKNQYDKNFNELSILYNTRKLSKRKFIEEIDPLLNGNRFEKECIKFNSKYIYTDENKHIFNDFLEAEEEIILLSSPYGTGKTYTFKQLIPKFEKILFITYRQSLANSLYDELQEKGFENYNDLTNNEIQKAERLIIQLDSLIRLNVIDNITTQNYISSYDLVVVDEMEGILSHFNAKTLKNKEMICNILTQLLKETKKIFCLDGDLHNRSIDYIKNTIQKDFKYYKNEYIPLKKKIQFTRDLEYFNNEITQKLKENKKIVLPSMLCNPTQEYKKKYDDMGYKVIIHNGIEKNNKILRDYKNEWNKCDILLYSPTIEAGVDFDKEYFDCCYGFMSNNSTSARAFSQMLHRVRNFKDDNVLIYIGNLFYSENVILHYPDSLNKNFLESYDTKTGIGNIQKYNKCEELNTRDYLLNDFINIIERKGYEWEILTQKQNKPKPYDYLSRKEGILNSKILSNEYLYAELIEKQKKGLLEEEETYILDKYFLSKKFCIDIEKIDDEFIENHFRKEYIIDNYNKFEESEDKIEKTFDNDFLGDKEDKINIIFSWFKDKEGNRIEYLKSDELRNHFKNFFKDPSIRKLFPKYPKMKGDKKLFENVNNHILNELGFEFIKKRKQYKDKETNKMKEYNLYTLTKMKIINDYIDRNNNDNIKAHLLGL